VACLLCGRRGISGCSRSHQPSDPLQPTLRGAPHPPQLLLHGRGGGGGGLPRALAVATGPRFPLLCRCPLWGIKPVELRWSPVPASRGPDGARTSSWMATGGLLPLLLLSGVHRVLFSISFSCVPSPCLSSHFHPDRYGSPRRTEAQRHCRIRIRTQDFWLPAQSSCPWARLPGG